MDDREILGVLHATARAVRASLDALEDWGLAGTRPGQYRSDLVADEVGVARLREAGLAVLSEESGRHEAPGSLLAVIDPVDGSTNASRGVPWFATSICVLDDAGPRAALVVNQATGVAFEATRGGGAFCDGVPVVPSGAEGLGSSVIGLSGWPPAHLGWRQFRALGALALDLCAVASGMLDGFIDCSRDAHGPWDYLGGMLVCAESGAFVADAYGRDLVVTRHDDRRTVLAAATPALAEEITAARRRLDTRS